ncbi:MAG: hypothetical protein R3A52_18565 [Polyangiales bacterium]
MEQAADATFHDAGLRALRVDLDRATVTLDLDVYVDDTEETAPCAAVFEGVTSVTMDPISLGLGGRVDVGDEVDGPDGAVWVFVDRSNGFVRLRAERVTMRVAGREGVAVAE